MSLRHHVIHRTLTHLCFLLLPALLSATTVSKTIPGDAGPWSQTANPGFDYGVHDNADPVMVGTKDGISFAPGATITVTYAGGKVTASAYYCCYPYVDANGQQDTVTNTYNSTNGKFPGFYMGPGPVYLVELVGTFTDKNGVIVGPPFALGDGPTKLTVPTGATQLQLGVNDNLYSDNDGSFSVNISTDDCHVNPDDINLFAGGPYSLNGQPTGMRAKFTPTVDGLPMGLADAAAACDVRDFDWQQTVDVWPTPGALFSASPSLANWPPGVAFTAPKPNGSFPDPPNGGYTCPTCPASMTLNTAARYPFYWDPNTTTFDWSLAHNETANTLSFVDYPSDPCLPGGDPGLQMRFCSNSSSSLFSDLEFTTKLVGIRKDGSIIPNLFSWKWKSTFNGVCDAYGNCSGTGGIVAIMPTISNYLPVDPASGSGGVTITSVNAVLQTPPSVRCTANPTTLWPPNSKPVLVTISGTVTPGTQPIPSGSTSYFVIDKYGQIQPTGSLVLTADGGYTFGVSLIAARNGDDLNGRTFTIVVQASDKIGNVGSCSVVVVVPHDQSQ